MIDPTELIADGHDPASDLEEREEREHGQTVDRPAEDYAAAIGRVLAFFLEGQTLGQIGMRVLVAVHKLRPDLIGGMSFQEIAAQAGQGRSAAHNLSEEFEQYFPIRGRLDRSELARLRYRRSHGHDRDQAPGTARMKLVTAGPPWVSSPSQPVQSRGKG